MPVIYVSGDKNIHIVADFLKLPLDAYMAQFEKVKVVHTIKREGLIRARLIGIDLSTGETLTFLDSHCECNIGNIESPANYFYITCNYMY